MPFVGKPTGGTEPNASASDRQVEDTKYVAQVYVNRRKMWEYRANTESEAFTKASTEQKKYKGSNSIIVVRKAV
jgi:hypothetical protein